MCIKIFHCDVYGKRFNDVTICAKHMEVCIGKLKCSNCDKQLHIGSYWLNIMNSYMKRSYRYT